MYMYMYLHLQSACNQIHTLHSFSATEERNGCTAEVSFVLDMTPALQEAETVEVG